MDKLPLLIYDSKCTLCLRFQKALSFLDNEISFVSIYEDELYQKYPELDRSECDEVIHLITEDSKILKAGEVITYLMKRNPAVKKFAWLIDKESSQKTVDAFYGKVKEMRDKQRKKCRSC